MKFNNRIPNLTMFLFDCSDPWKHYQVSDGGESSCSSIRRSGHSDTLGKSPTDEINVPLKTSDANSNCKLICVLVEYIMTLNWSVQGKGHLI